MANLKQIILNGINILDIIHPVGSLYISTENTDPSTIFGGAWERVKGKMLIGLDEDDTDFDTVGKVGGEKTHTLSDSEIPAHTHKMGLWSSGQEAGGYGLVGGQNSFINRVQVTANYADARVTEVNSGGGVSQQYASICGILYVGAYRLELLNQVFLKYVKEVWCNG